MTKSVWGWNSGGVPFGSATRERLERSAWTSHLQSIVLLLPRSTPAHAVITWSDRGGERRGARLDERAQPRRSWSTPANDPHISSAAELEDVVRSVRRQRLTALADDVFEAPPALAAAAAARSCRSGGADDLTVLPPTEEGAKRVLFLLPIEERVWIRDSPAPEERIRWIARATRRSRRNGGIHHGRWRWLAYHRADLPRDFAQLLVRLRCTKRRQRYAILRLALHPTKPIHCPPVTWFGDDREDPHNFPIAPLQQMTHFRAEDELRSEGVG